MGTAAAAAPLALGAEKSMESIMARANAAKAFTMQVADAMPAGSYDFKPVPEMRSFGEVMVHIGQAMVFYVGRFSKVAVPDDMKAPKVAEKEAAKKYLAATFDYCNAALGALTPADLDKMFPGRPNTPPMSGWDLMLNGFIHTSHHRGYADVYLRLKGITPPTYNV
ncbi:MAG TPA: DinB family protein [Bryobacteraceae bacterium]|nr:DinB family protein [Bryobacteraceae bacterium]